jgi:hypothetical protein
LDEGDIDGVLEERGSKKLYISTSVELSTKRSLNHRKKGKGNKKFAKVAARNFEEEEIDERGMEENEA